MSTLAEMFPTTRERQANPVWARVREEVPPSYARSESEAVEDLPVPEYAAQQPAVWDPQVFAQEQILSLVQRVFVPGWPRPARQIVFSGVDQQTGIAEICHQTGEALSSQIAGTVCVVEAAARPQFGLLDFPSPDIKSAIAEKPLRDSSRQISRKVWSVPGNVFLGQNTGALSAAWLHGRLEQLRFEFDYTILQAPACAHSGVAALLGQLTDGVILVLQANSTRRITAKKVKETLRAANARLLGSVLSQRAFPIPQEIYGRF